jgi:hypothetical protein
VVLVYYKVMTVEDSTSQGGLLMSFIGIVALAAVVGLLIKIRKISITSYQSVYQNQEDQIFPDYQEGDQSQNI